MHFSNAVREITARFERYQLFINRRQIGGAHLQSPSREADSLAAIRRRLRDRRGDEAQERAEAAAFAALHDAHADEIARRWGE